MRWSKSTNLSDLCPRNVHCQEQTNYAGEYISRPDHAERKEGKTLPHFECVRVPESVTHALYRMSSGRDCVVKKSAKAKDKEMLSSVCTSSAFPPPLLLLSTNFVRTSSPTE